MSDERDARLAKRHRLAELGLDPYAPERYERSHTIPDLLDRFDALEGEAVRIAGRIVSYRLMGKAGFADISDGDHRIQAYFRRDDLGERLWTAYLLLDIGDHVGLRGELFRTKTGERSIHVRDLLPLSKCLHALPLGKEKDGARWYGLADTEVRYRHRHLDLLANPEARRMLVARMRIVSAVRRFFEARGFLEVETPYLQLVAGGAAATPFVTHYNAYDLDVKLRISLELYLKRLVCGDLPKVFEIGRVFRNEGVSNRHNPEFTLLEWYEAYANLEDVMTCVEELFRFVAREVFGTTVLELPVRETMTPAERRAAEGSVLRIDFGPRWRRVDLLESIAAAVNVDPADLLEFDRARRALADRKLVNEETGKRVALAEEHSLGGLIEKLLEVFVEPDLVAPSFVVGYPIETSPLAKKDPHRPGFTRRFEGYLRGREVCNAFSEINDPLDQRERFLAQLQAREGGAQETHPMDEEFVYALECGMPPTGGCGIGMDRLAMLLTGADNLREVILFPTMKPEAADH